MPLPIRLNPEKLKQLAEKVLTLNPNCPEIGAGMLAHLIQLAKEGLGKTSDPNLGTDVPDSLRFLLPPPCKRLIPTRQPLAFNYRFIVAMLEVDGHGAFYCNGWEL